MSNSDLSQNQVTMTLVQYLSGYSEFWPIETTAGRIIMSASMMDVSLEESEVWCWWFSW